MTSWTVLQPLRERALALSAREQSLMLLVIAVVFYFFIDALILSPQNLRLQALLDSQEATQAQITAVRAELDNVKPASAEKLLRHESEAQQLKAQVLLLERIRASVNTAEPHLNTLVTDVLQSEHPRVVLVSLKTLPVKPLVSLPANARPTSAPSAAAALYRHGVELEVRGNYLDLLAYVQGLESQAQGVLWSDVRLSTLNYPESALRITLYMLSDQARLKLS